MSILRTAGLSSLLICSFLFAQQAQGPLNDQRVVDLVAMGVSESEIIRMIAIAPKFDFDLRPISTDAMLKQGVSEEVIKPMSARNVGKPFTPRAQLTQR